MRHTQKVSLLRLSPSERILFSSFWQPGNIVRLLPFATKPIRDICGADKTFREQCQSSLPLSHLDGLSSV